MITYILEEDATSQQRNLKSLYVNVDMVCVPGIGSNSIGYQCCKESIEVEQKKDSPVHVRIRYKVDQKRDLQNPADQQLNQEDPANALVRGIINPGEYTDQLKPVCGFKGSEVRPPAMQVTNG
jgi:hypothetical protein